MLLKNLLENGQKDQLNLWMSYLKKCGGKLKDSIKLHNINKDKKVMNGSNNTYPQIALNFLKTCTLCDKL